MSSPPRARPRDLIVIAGNQPNIVVIDTTDDEQYTFYVDEFRDEPVTTAEELCDVLAGFLPLKGIKAIVFVIVSTDFSTFQESNDYRLGCRDFCKKNDIFFASVPFTTLEAIYATSQTQTLVKEGEQVMIVFSIMPGFPTGITLLREKDRYRILKYNRAHGFMFTDEWKEEFFDIYDPKKVILVHNTDIGRPEEVEMYEDFFEEYNAVTITQGPERELVSKGAVEKVLHLMGEKISPYDVAPPCLNAFYIHIGSDVVMEALIYDDPLPFEKSVVVDVQSSKKLSLFVKINSLGRKELLQEIKLSTFKTKKIKITLKVDVNSLYEFNVDPIDDKESLDEKTSKMNIDKDLNPPEASISDARIVFGKQFFAVFVKEKDDFRMIETDSGSDEIPIYIAFTEEEPIIGEAAKEAYNTNPEAVVFDLIKLCSISNADIMSPKWGFRVSKENESMMVNVETSKGEKKSSVDILLAMILRRALEIIKDETGKKMDKIEIQFCSFSPNDVLKQTFVDAGKHLEIEIEFV